MATYPTAHPTDDEFPHADDLFRADTGSARADAFLWTHVPGNSGGSCNGGPPNGTFFPALAIGMAERANGRLGPGDPSRPY